MELYLLSSLIIAAAIYAMAEMGIERLCRNGWINETDLIFGISFLKCWIIGLLPIVRWLVVILIIYCLIRNTRED